MQKHSVISDNLNRLYIVYQLNENDYTLLNAFYKRERAALAREEFFYPYTDSELYETLSNAKSFCLGAFYNQELVAVSIIDGDIAYGDTVKEKILNNIDLTSEIGKEFNCRIKDNFHEYAGLFVSEKYQGYGLITKLFELLCQYFIDNLQGCLFALVHKDNIASNNNMINKNFINIAQITEDEIYTFNYYYKAIN